MRIFILSLYLCSLAAGAVVPVNPSMAPNDWSVQLQRVTRLMLEQEQLLQQLQAEVRHIRGENEVLQHRLKALTQRQRSMTGDLDQRLSRLETGQTSMPNSAEPRETVTLLPDADQPPANNALATHNAEPLSPEATFQPNTDTPPLPTQTPDQAPSEALADGEKAQYKQAFDWMQSGALERAITGFKLLIKTYPQGEYADNAQYWMGESYYSQKDYNAALTSFNAVLENYPDSNKRAHALLKIGYAYVELSNQPKARQVLEYVRDKFPGTATARLAKKRLQSLR